MKSKEILNSYYNPDRHATRNITAEVTGNENETNEMRNVRLLVHFKGRHKSQEFI